MREILNVDGQRPEDSIISEASSILKAGGIIAYPTETFYGLGADGRNEEAIKRIFLIKGRTFQNPISLIIGDVSYVKGLVEEIPEFALHLMEKFWPGALTIVFKASTDVSPLLTAGTRKIGIRLSSHPVAAALAVKLGRPITATSANPSGGHECTRVEEFVHGMGDHIDIIIDAGQTPGGSGSTVIDVTTEPPTILREGAIPGHKLTNPSFV